MFEIFESIPSDLNIKTLHTTTADGLINMINNTTTNLYVTVMYWSLLECLSNNIDDLLKTPIPYNCSPTDEKKYKLLGSDKGRELFQALRDAGLRGVNLYFITSVERPPLQRSNKEDQLLKACIHTKNSNSNVNLYYINTDDWWKGGIFHQKLWISDPELDTASVYIGSANMDWLSLTQVKEVGIFLQNKNIAQDLLAYWKNWQTLSLIPNPSEYISTFMDYTYRITRAAPCWSPYVALANKNNLPASKTCTSPLNSSSYNPKNILTPGTMNGGKWFITGSPNALCVNKRTLDEDGIIYTINEAKKSVCISVMDVVPSSIYANYQIWWPKFYDAILNAVITRNIDVKILASKWMYTSHIQKQYLQNLISTCNTCKIGQNNANWNGAAGTKNTCKAKCIPGKIKCGNIQIKEFTMPGWNQTQGNSAKYEAYSRVNHTKYVVTDNRTNIGTSNWTWGYFYNTAGSSFNTDNLSIVEAMQNIFNRDWNSEYAIDIMTRHLPRKKCITIIIICSITLISLFAVIYFISK